MKTGLSGTGVDGVDTGAGTEAAADASASAEMTDPKVTSDLLMWPPSFSR